jgi:hypothetical protein
MRNLLLATLALCLHVTTAGAQSEPPLPAGAAALEARLLTRVGPQTRGWIKQEAARQNAAGTASELTVRNAIAANPSLSGLPDGDINALAFLVMMEASKSAREDLKSIMSGVKQINDAKAALRKKAKDSKATSESPKQTTVKAASEPRQPARANLAPVQPRPIPKAAFARKLQSARNDMDSLSELGEEQSLRLQMQMDKMATSAATISKLMKKFSDTSQSITGNMK